MSINHPAISERSLADHEALARQCAELGVEVQAVPACEESRCTVACVMASAATSGSRAAATDCIER